MVWCSFGCLLPLLHSVSFAQLLYCAVKRIVNIRIVNINESVHGKEDQAT